MKPDITKFAAILQTPVYPPTLHQFRPEPKAAAIPKPAKRDNVKSRDTREDRGTRCIRLPTTLPRGGKVCKSSTDGHVRSWAGNGKFRLAQGSTTHGKRH